MFNLYRGVLSPLLMKAATQSIMFGTYTQYSRLLSENLPLKTAQSKVVGAVLAGATEAILMPLERVQVSHYLFISIAERLKLNVF